MNMQPEQKLLNLLSKHPGSYPSHKTIAAYCNVSVASVPRIIKKLTEAGVLKIESSQFPRKFIVLSKQL
ncbi:MAG: helix-turn-helix domain-containing protein [Thermoanaerobacteraceae bacterium]|nr:helix-turn-helix domain-containing protein [Thermoanaerobacteraceae bacterium]